MPEQRPISVGLIGAGGFVRHSHLPNLIRHPGFQLHAVADINESSAREVAAAAGSRYATVDAGQILEDPEVEMVLIATPHHTHADLSQRAARAGKHIYCEKPMGLNETECLAVCETVARAGVCYLAGYNRAVAPFTRRIRSLLSSLNAPILIHHRFADWNPYGHGWLIDESLSGGRLLGEAGHALDTMCRLVGEDPIRVYAEGGNFAEPSQTGAPDSALITLGFPSGSAGTLFLSSVASNHYPKEELLVTCAGYTIVVENFQKLKLCSPDSTEEEVHSEPDKGLLALLDCAYAAIREGGPLPTGPEEALRTSRITFAAVRSVRTRERQTLAGRSIS